MVSVLKRLVERYIEIRTHNTPADIARREAEEFLKTATVEQLKEEEHKARLQLLIRVEANLNTRLKYDGGESITTAQVQQLEVLLKSTL